MILTIINNHNFLTYSLHIVIMPPLLLGRLRISANKNYTGNVRVEGNEITNKANIMSIGNAYAAPKIKINPVKYYI